ncbi:hypothetical protein ONZ45_g16428 [Pleurotus djamor]|nr:hypothetical protein ONZ45_g16428 [Pleurotus djamor]
MNNQQPNQAPNQQQQNAPYLQQIAQQYAAQNPFQHAAYPAGVQAGAWGVHSSEQRSMPGHWDVPGSSMRHLSKHMNESLAAAQGGRNGRPFALATAFTDPANQHFGVSSPMEPGDLRAGVTKYKLDQIPQHLHPIPKPDQEYRYNVGNCGEFSTLYQAAMRGFELHPEEKFNIVWACSVLLTNPRTSLQFCEHCQAYANNLVASMPRLVIVDIARRGYEIYASSTTRGIPGFEEEVNMHVAHFRGRYKQIPGPHSGVTQVACPCSQ